MIKTDLVFRSIPVAGDRESIFVGINIQNAVSEPQASQPMLAHSPGTQGVAPGARGLPGCCGPSEPFWHSEAMSVQLNDRDTDRVQALNPFLTVQAASVLAH